MLRHLLLVLVLEVTEAIRGALEWMRILLEVVPPMITHLKTCLRTVLTVFTDASSEETRNVTNAKYREFLKEVGWQNHGRHVQLGWTVYEGSTLVESGYHITDQAILAEWRKRQPIALGETLGAIMGVYYGVGDRTGIDVKLFVDNQASLAAIIKGYSSDQAADELVQAFHLWCASKDVRLWCEYVPSKFNPADEPSRDAKVDGKAVEKKEIPELFRDPEGIKERLLQALKISGRAEKRGTM